MQLTPWISLNDGLAEDFSSIPDVFLDTSAKDVMRTGMLVQPAEVENGLIQLFPSAAADGDARPSAAELLTTPD
jgi:hypothetical protein